MEKNEDENKKKIEVNQSEKDDEERMEFTHKSQEEDANDMNSFNKNSREYKSGMSSNSKFYLLLCLLFVLVIGVLLMRSGIVDFSNIALGQKAELKYTETATAKKKQDGVYLNDVSDVVENVMPSIVAITSKTLVSSGRFGPSYFGENQYSEGAGSGIIISKNDKELLILTNNHVVEGAEELSVQFINEKNIDATIKGLSERKDIAVIAVQLKDIDNETMNAIKIATLGDSNSLKVGNGIIAIGNALGYGQSVTTGVISALNREVTVDNYSSKMIQLDAAINGGNSGGALLNSKGEVVGINSVKYSSNGSTTTASVEGMGFAIPISDIKDLVTKLMNGEEDEGSASIGIEGYMVTKEYSEAYNMPIGFYVSKISEDSKAKDLDIGNIITKIDGKEIGELSDLTGALEDKKKGDKVILTVKYASGRSYQEKEVEVTLS